MEAEFFVDIKGFDGIYQVSNLGNVKSLRFNKEHVMKKTLVSGYHKVMLRKNKKSKPAYVHRLVAQGFLNFDLTNKLLVVDHINRIKNDNNVNNLQVVSTRVNTTKDRINEHGSIGVFYSPERKKYFSKIYINKKAIWLSGFSNDKEKIATFYNTAVLNLSKYNGDAVEFRNIIKSILNL